MASVSFGFVLVRVRVRFTLKSAMNHSRTRIIPQRLGLVKVELNLAASRRDGDKMGFHLP
jgi:hypothetical protein